MINKRDIKEQERRNKDDHDEKIREMIELYTMVPLSPYTIRKMKKSSGKNKST